MNESPCKTASNTGQTVRLFTDGGCSDGMGMVIYHTKYVFLCISSLVTNDEICKNANAVLISFIF